jgi:hypothetical protein
MAGMGSEKAFENDKVIPLHMALLAGLRSLEESVVRTQAVKRSSEVILWMGD